MYCTNDKTVFLTLQLLTKALKSQRNLIQNPDGQTQWYHAPSQQIISAFIVQVKSMDKHLKKVKLLREKQA